MQVLGSVPGHQPLPFDACVAALNLGGVPAANAPGAHGTGALAGAARRLHDVSSILIRLGVLEYREHEGGGKGRGELRWLGATSVTARLALGAEGGAVETGYGVGALKFNTGGKVEHSAAVLGVGAMRMMDPLDASRKGPGAEGSVQEGAGGGGGAGLIPKTVPCEEFP
jgi:hypothetical protein